MSRKAAPEPMRMRQVSSGFVSAGVVAVEVEVEAVVEAGAGAVLDKSPFCLMK